ncbi:MAG: transglycosylase domain-containing protein [Corynebacterium sp.]|nr:transglycosylase domain-containing protein [Corynebacterium sp.]
MASTEQRPKRRKKFWGILGGIIAACILIPLAVFIVAYIVVDVPEPEELATKQVVEVYASDSETQLARVVPPDGNRTAVNLDQIPEYARNAVLAAEDREFYSNSGFSITGLGRAVMGVITGDSEAGGGSTITQQYVKNTLVGDERSLERKAKELVYSVKMTNEWSKDEVLQAYLNTIYFGRNAYGIDAAAQAYFGIPASELNIEQSAVLAASIQRPSQLDPWTNRAEAEARWNYVLDGLVDAGWLDAGTRQPLVYPEVRDPAEVNTYTDAEGTNGLIQTQVFNELGSLGFSEEEIQTLGLRITTTIDPDAQDSVVNAVENALDGQMESMRSAAVSVEPATGAVRAYYGGSDPTGYDYANAGLQTGSTFKIFGLAAAVQQGIPTNALYSSQPYELENGAIVTNVDGQTCGTCTLSNALLNSYNTSFLRLQADLERQSQDTADMAHALGVAESFPGVEQTLHEENARPYDGIILGQYQSRPIDMAHALGTLANNGIYHDTYFVERVENSAGDVIYEHEQQAGERAVAEQVATNVIAAMNPIAAHANGNALAGGRPSAAKTGTAQLGETGYNKDAWMIGATPQLATAVWVGSDTGEPLLTSAGATVYGSGLPATIWKNTMDGALANKPVESFTAAESIGWAHNYTGGYDYSGSYNSGAATATATAPATPTAPATAVPQETAPQEQPAWEQYVPDVVVPDTNTGADTGAGAGTGAGTGAGADPGGTGDGGGLGLFGF